MNELVINRQGTPATSQDKLSLLSGNDEKSIQDLIVRYKSELEIFGTLDFDNIKTTGRPKKLYYLNEQQSYLFMTFLKNTKVVKDFKIALIREFFEMRESLNNSTKQIQPQPTHHQINGYKSQLSQHNSKIRELEKQNALLQAKLENALTPDSIWNIVNDGLKYREAKKQVKELAPLFA